MKAKMCHINAGISKWYLKEVAPLGWKAMLMTPLVNLGIANTMNKYADAIALLTDENGEIDIDTLHRDYVELVSKQGAVEMFGVKFNAQDVETLCETIKAEIPAK